MPFLFIHWQTFMGSAMDIFLQMSTDSPFQQPFLETCSTETWFRTIAMVLRAPSQDSKLLEKLSIILQKLSKFRYLSTHQYWPFLLLINVIFILDILIHILIFVCFILRSMLNWWINILYVSTDHFKLCNAQSMFLMSWLLYFP